MALEINAYPSRLDLSDTNCRKAKEYGVSFALGSDAHSVAGLQQMELGIATARRGWVTAEEMHQHPAARRPPGMARKMRRSAPDSVIPESIRRGTRAPGY